MSELPPSLRPRGSLLGCLFPLCVGVVLVALTSVVVVWSLRYVLNR